MTKTKFKISLSKLNSLSIMKWVRTEKKQKMIQWWKKFGWLNLLKLHLCCNKINSLTINEENWYQNCLYFTYLVVSFIKTQTNPGDSQLRLCLFLMTFALEQSLSL